MDCGSGRGGGARSVSQHSPSRNGSLCPFPNTKAKFNFLQPYQTVTHPARRSGATSRSSGTSIPATISSRPCRAPRFISSSRSHSWFAPPVPRTHLSKPRVPRSPRETFRRSGRQTLHRIRPRPRPPAPHPTPAQVKSWRRKMSERLPPFRPARPLCPWTPKELAMIGAMRDREVARRINRSLSAVRGKKFSLRATRK